MQCYCATTTAAAIRLLFAKICAWTEREREDRLLYSVAATDANPPLLLHQINIPVSDNNEI